MAVNNKEAKGTAVAIPAAVEAAAVKSAAVAIQRNPE